jgi:RimJ/RimL family protein N-acetyltransferase
MKACVIETERLSLRQLKADDFSNLFPVFADEQTMEFYPSPFSQEMVRSFIEKQLTSYKTNHFGLWAVELKGTRQFLGDCGITLQDIDNQIVPEIGYHFNKKYWHRGFATEAVQGCIAYAFNEFNMKEIYIHTYVKNIPSIRVAERMHFQKIKTYSKFLKNYNTYWDHSVYMLKNNNYKE